MAAAAASPIPEVHLGECRPEEPGLSLATEGVLRYVWHSAFGDILVEVRDGRSFVNGKAVEPACVEPPRSC